MKRRNRFTIPSKYILFALTLLCVGTMSVSFLTDFDGGILNSVSGYVLIPVQKGINIAGGWARSRVDNLADLQQINEENQSLKEQVAELTLENNMLMQQVEWAKPVVHIYDKGVHNNADILELDGFRIGRIIGEYLLQLGHQRIAFVTSTFETKQVTRVRRLEG